MVEILEQQKVVEESVGIWKDDDHTELNDGVDAYVRRVRNSWYNRELRLKLEKR